jgi:hypothetical protein
MHEKVIETLVSAGAYLKMNEFSKNGIRDEHLMNKGAYDTLQLPICR